MHHVSIITNVIYLIIVIVIIVSVTISEKHPTALRVVVVSSSSRHYDLLQKKKKYTSSSSFIRLAAAINSNNNVKDDFNNVDDKDVAFVQHSAKLMKNFLRHRERRRKKASSGGINEKKKKKKKSNTMKRYRFATSVSASTSIIIEEDDENEDLLSLSSSPSSSFHNGYTKLEEVVQEKTLLSLDEYMNLPIDQYVLLDERYISRNKNGFQFILPFGDIEVSPGKKLISTSDNNNNETNCLLARCDLSVHSDVQNRQNTITASNFQIIVNKDALLDTENDDRDNGGEDDKDNNFKKSDTKKNDKDQNNVISSALTTTQKQNNSTDQVTKEMEEQQQVLRRHSNELDQKSLRSILKKVDGASPEADGKVILKWKEQQQHHHQQQKHYILSAKFNLNAEVTLPIPIPRILLNPVGSIILKLTFSQILPKILHLISNDYKRRWRLSANSSVVRGAIKEEGDNLSFLKEDDDNEEATTTFENGSMF